MRVITVTELADAMLAMLEGDVDVATFDEATERARFHRFGESKDITVVVRATPDDVERVTPILRALGKAFVTTALQHVRDGCEEALLDDLQKAIASDYRQQMSAGHVLGALDKKENRNHVPNQA